MVSDTAPAWHHTVRPRRTDRIDRSRAGWSSRTSPLPNPRSSSMASSSRAAWRALSRSLARAAVTSADSVYERRPVTSISRAWASGAGTANQTALPRSPRPSSLARVGWCPHRPPDSPCTICSPRPPVASAGIADAVGGVPSRQPRQQSKTLQTSSRPVPRPRRYSQSSASGTHGGEAAATALGTREGRWRGGALRALGMKEPRGACGAGPADAIGSPSTPAVTDASRSPPPPARPPPARAGCWPRVRWPSGRNPPEGRARGRPPRPHPGTPAARLSRTWHRTEAATRSTCPREPPANC